MKMKDAPLGDEEYDEIPSFSWRGSVAGQTWMGGTIARIGEPVTKRNYNDTGDEVGIAIETIQESGERVNLWILENKDSTFSPPRPCRKYQALAAAVIESGADELLEGAEFKIKHSEDVKRPKGVEKIFKATYTPPAKGIAMSAPSTELVDSPF
jgi:hypothetical protein